MFIKEVKELFENMNELEFKIRLNKLYKLVGITRLFLDGVEVITDCVNETTEYNFATQQYDIFIEDFLFLSNSFLIYLYILPKKKYLLVDNLILIN